MKPLDGVRTPCQNKDMEKAFAADRARYDKALRDAGAIFTTEDGLVWIDETKVSATLIRAYRTFCLYGFANGLM